MELRAHPFILRAVTDEDWLLEHQLSRDAEVVRWTSYPSEMTETEARARITRQQERARRGVTQRYTIWDGDTRLGTCGLGSLDQASPEAMYAVLPAARGRGIARTALCALTGWAGTNGRPAVTLVTVEGNAASAAVARRAGFSIVETFEGQHRDTASTLHRWRWRPIGSVTASRSATT
jgi:RimJ/RimL family protein N-acetyltransferase